MTGSSLKFYQRRISGQESLHYILEIIWISQYPLAIDVRLAAKNFSFRIAMNILALLRKQYNK